ncbi:DUF952 domain-containing protein [Novosphingobium cyanobacteriorum]|uniref:DUF952 domain-containing protein n=1 Tax=Novosphingobium cyanobacteriorum TaxID=3024215 RepID=A0ABT6CD57_9SPHN|nr:DUF952 domain-containing protein [Novosphingobium cyanobacteriorum]MDF8331869.1 DUF952 domain-containing protein [Novosphingobium cyanobacteriorum]
MKDFPTVAYKVLTGDQMNALLRDGLFQGAPVDLADGFIHLSAADQVTGTVDKHFAGQTGLHVVAVDLEALGDAVKWEVSRGGALFPHVYGDLPLSACKAHQPLTRSADGTVILP